MQLKNNATRIREKNATRHLNRVSHLLHNTHYICKVKFSYISKVLRQTRSETKILPKFNQFQNCSSQFTFKNSHWKLIAWWWYSKLIAWFTFKNSPHSSTQYTLTHKLTHTTTLTHQHTLPPFSPAFTYKLIKGIIVNFGSTKEPLEV